MYIKQIVLDGFKSYAQRTEISGFDPLFNAITGLNGSGKSNILDAICFLLGISNLSQVTNFIQSFSSSLSEGFSNHWLRPQLGLVGYGSTYGVHDVCVPSHG